MIKLNIFVIFVLLLIEYSLLNIKVMVIFTVTFLLLRFITTILYYIVVGIGYAVFYACGFTFLFLRDVYRHFRARRGRYY